MAALEGIAEEADASVLVSGTLRREEEESARFLASMAGLWVRGVEVDWSGVYRRPCREPGGPADVCVPA